MVLTNNSDFDKLFLKLIETDAKRTIQTPESTINEKCSIFVEI